MAECGDGVQHELTLRRHAIAAVVELAAQSLGLVVVAVVVVRVVVAHGTRLSRADMLACSGSPRAATS